MVSAHNEPPLARCRGHVRASPRPWPPCGLGSACGRRPGAWWARGKWARRAIMGGRGGQQWVAGAGEWRSGAWRMGRHGACMQGEGGAGHRAGPRAEGGAGEELFSSPSREKGGAEGARGRHVPAPGFQRWRRRAVRRCVCVCVREGCVCVCAQASVCDTQRDALGARVGPLVSGHQASMLVRGLGHP